MIKAVIFDMFETLITHYHSPLYFGTQMAADAGIPEERFQSLWRSTEYARTIGDVTLEEVLEIILRENHCYSKELLKEIVEKRIATKEDCFRNLHSEIIRIRNCQRTWDESSTSRLVFKRGNKSACKA